MIVLAEWDTENFGIKVGNLTFEGEITKESITEARLKAKAEDYDLLYIKGVNIPSDLLDESLFLADEKVVYSQHKQKGSDVVPCAISVLHQPVSNDLLELAFESGKYSRYKLDKKFPDSVFPTLYQLWLENSLKGEIADDVLTIQHNETIVGLLTYKKEGKNYDIGLVSVSPNYAGKGIGTRLMQSFISGMDVDGEIEVATQKNNTVACHYYEKNGFKIKSITNIYHFWIK